VTPNLHPTLSSLRVAFWRTAALVTDLALRNRTGMLRAWPYLVLAGSGVAAYALGRLIGGLALGALP
jgi:hypothetical protein